jgi:8-oxo-dGTP pyrophosphatase MutT (NUDIX family)
MTLGKRISRERPSPRYVDNSRSGPIPLLAVESLAGKIDPTTFGPHKDQDYVNHPFVPAPGVAPVQGSEDYRLVRNAESNMQRNMLIQDEGSGHGTPQEEIDEATRPFAEDTATKELLQQLVKAVNQIGGWDNTGGPGLHPEADEEEIEDAEKEATGGISVATGAQGVDLSRGPKKRKDHGKRAKLSFEESAMKAEQTFADIRRWRENSLNRVKKGQAPRLFEDLPFMVTDSIWPRLQNARTREEVMAAFKGDILAKGDDDMPLGRRAAGIAVQAEDTGRVLLIQRVPDKHDDDDAFARWEWPGGKLDGGGDGTVADTSVWAGALREWHEETGAVLPEGTKPLGGWVSDDGEYEGFVVKIPCEADLTLNPQPEEASQAGWWDPDELDDDSVRQKVHDDLDSIKPILETE